MRKASAKNPPMIVLSLLLVPIILFLHNLNFYRQLFLYKEAYLLFCIYLLLPLVVYFLLIRVLKVEQLFTASILLLSSLFYFFFGALQDGLLQVSLTSMLGKTYVLLAMFMCLISFLFIKKNAARKLVKPLSYLLLFFAISEAIILLFKLPGFNQEPQLEKDWPLSRVSNHNDTLNVHHLIFDGYTNSATLKAVFAFNNPLDSFLLREGFYVAKQSKSNYNFTPYSLAATLNLDYLKLDNKQLERTFKNYFLGAGVYKRNKVFDFFSQRSYVVNHFSILDDYEHLEKLGTFVPQTPAYSVRNQTLERIFLNPWLWQKMRGADEDSIPQSVKNSLLYYQEYNIKALEHSTAMKSKKPIYNFTHFLIPHEPYVFAKSSIDRLVLSDLMDHKQGYIKQVQYANVLIQKIVGDLKKNKRNIIIIQGDHGFREFNASAQKPLQQNETFNAVYFPDQQYQKLHDSISLVNTYRLILSQYFGQNLPMLKDEYFIPSN